PENDGEVSELLQHVVALRLFALWKPQSDVFGNVVSDVPELQPGRSEVAPQVSAPQRVGEIRQAVQHEQPREEEMPAPAGREIAIGRQSDPARKAARLELPVRASRKTEHTR